MKTPTFPFQPSDNEGPIFKAPWEAQAFGMVIALHSQGAFDWSEWADQLSKEIQRAQQHGDPDLGDTYYSHWLNALEQLLLHKQLTTEAEVSARVNKWRRAYLATEHGQAIELSNADD
ncbi:MAG: nitrile hydratase accessory protein [Pseudohongiellaceae bacterium]|jgi:nitrile hydratase accessory protein